MQSIRPNGPCRDPRTCQGTSSRYSWRSTRRPSCCGASRGLHLGADRLGGRDRQRVHPAPGVLLGAPAPGGPLVEPGRDRAGGGPLAAAAGLVGGPATGGVQAPRPAPATDAGAGLRLLAGPRALGLRRAEPADRPRAASLPGPGLQRLQRRAGLSRKPPVPRGGGTDTGVLLPVLLLAYRRLTGPLEEARRQPASAMGGDRWNNCIPG